MKSIIFIAFEIRENKASYNRIFERSQHDFQIEYHGSGHNFPRCDWSNGECRNEGEWRRVLQTLNNEWLLG